MAMIPDARKLERLRTIARLLRDRDLGAAAQSLGRVRETERQIEELARHEAQLNAVFAAATDARDMLQMQTYGQLVGRQSAELAKEKEARAAEAEATLAVARRSFARATVADSLAKRAEQERHAKRERGSKG